MLKKIRRGYMIEVVLPRENKYLGYSVYCIYKYSKETEKYLLSMWLKHKNIDDMFKIDAQKIDTQPISGDRDTIEENIIRIVEQASLNGFFDEYIERFEYTYRCFDEGNEVFEKEAMANAS